VANRIQKFLEQANLKLSSVASDVPSVSISMRQTARP
jgi:hypothetical protein